MAKTHILPQRFYIILLLLCITMKYSVFCVFILFFATLKSQPCTLKVVSIDSAVIEKNIAVKTKFDNKNSCIKYLNSWHNLLLLKGYISASIDSVAQTDTTITAFLFLGKLYSFKKIILPPEIENTTFAAEKNIAELPQKILDYYINNGYPFAKIGFENVVISNNNEIEARLKIDKSFAYTLDSIRVLGDVNITPNFLQHYLKLHKGSLYQHQKLQGIDEKLNTLPYISTYKTTSVIMLNKGYVVNLYLQPKKVNKFNAIIGFLPNSSANSNKLLLTVDANIFLQNVFAKGESVFLNWQQIQPQSPRIDIGFTMPYIFKTNADLSVGFNLYKRDSQYVTIATNAGVGFDINEKMKFKIFIANTSTRIIETDTNTIIATQKLPNVLDMNINELGVTYLHNVSNNNIVKHKGFEGYGTISFGQKIIKPNNTITNLKTNNYNYKSLYDSIATNTYQFKAKVYAAQYVPISIYSTIKLSANYGVIFSENYLQNQIFQIGGFKLLRGFDEENIFTKEYIVGSSEYRYSINNNSYFFGFVDAGFAKSIIQNKTFNYLGSGLGLALQTKQGILNISLAVGKRSDLPFSLKETKIHVGIINNF